MAVRRTVVFGVGGFNPDGLGDRRLIWIRGDGECGLQEKIYKSGILKKGILFITTFLTVEVIVANNLFSGSSPCLEIALIKVDLPVFV